MILRLQCPICDAVQTVHERMLGRVLSCPKCGKQFSLPSVEELASESEATSVDDDDNPFAELDYQAIRTDAKRRRKSLRRFASSPEPENDRVASVNFRKRELPKDDMDMTPMVDVTFLLLIFFMITASFTTEKALQQQVASDQTSNQPPPDEENETIKILIDEFNAYTVIFPDGGEVEATSKQELITVLKMAELDGSTEDASSLIIDAHEDSIHAAIVSALDAGRQNNLTKFKVNVVENLD